MGCWPIVRFFAGSVLPLPRFLSQESKQSQGLNLGQNIYSHCIYRGANYSGTKPLLQSASGVDVTIIKTTGWEVGYHAHGRTERHFREEMLPLICYITLSARIRWVLKARASETNMKELELEGLEILDVVLARQQ